MNSATSVLSAALPLMTHYLLREGAGEPHIGDMAHLFSRGAPALCLIPASLRALPARAFADAVRKISERGERAFK